jgi:ubiquinone/menaquinone biosynthesis C-methylase UbiE
MYGMFDAAFQTFYYTLINMIDIRKANNILEIACGTGKLLPLAINMKPI